MTDRKSQERLVVVPYKPGEAIRRRLFSWLAVLLTAAVFIGLGYVYKEVETAKLQERIDKLESQLEAAQQRAMDAANDLIALQQERAVDRVASDESAMLITDLQQTVQQLRKDITFYRDIMAPSENADGLQVKEIRMQPLRTPGRYSYKLVLTQVTNNRNFVEGVATVNLIGMKEGEQQILPLRDLEGSDSLGIKFRFRYFQNLEGELQLPDGFEPEKIQVVAQAKGRKTTKIERTFDWEHGA